VAYSPKSTLTKLKPRVSTLKGRFLRPEEVHAMKKRAPTPGTYEPNEKLTTN